MTRIPLLIVALLLPLAGCLGIPEGSVTSGDTVTADVTVTDLHTGEQLWTNPALTFVVGAGTSQLGFGFERAVIGMQQGGTETIRITNDPSLAWGDQVAVDGVFEDDLLGTIEESQFQQFFGEPVIGETFEPQFSFYTFRVESVNAGTVTYRVLPEDGQQDAVPHLGATLVTSIDADRDIMIQTLVADPGATFAVQPPSPFNPNTPLGLEPGAYRAVGNDGDQIVYEFNGVAHPDVVGHDLRITVDITDVVRGDAGAVEPVDGNVGVRTSPVINGVPDEDVDYGPANDDA